MIHWALLLLILSAHQSYTNKKKKGNLRKVTKLSLPDGQTVGGDKRITKLETKGTKLGQMRVGDSERALLGTQVLESNVCLFSFLVMDHGVSLRECTTLNILTGDSNVGTLKAQGTESKSFGSRPVNVLAFGYSLASVANNSCKVLVGVETFGETRDDLTNVLEGVLAGTGMVLRENLLGKLLGGRETFPRGGKPFSGRRLVVPGPVVSLLKHAPDPLPVLVNLLLGKSTLLDQLVSVDRQDGRLLLNRLVHLWLSEAGLVSLVVTVSSVTDNIDNHILLESSSPVSSKGTDIVDGLDIVTVDVEDGRIDRLGNIRGVRGRTGKSGVGGETNLVVDNQVDGATSAVVGEVLHTHGLVDNTLTSKGGVTMEQDTHGRGSVSLVTFKVLDSPGLTEDNGVFSLQVRRVGNKGQGNLLAARSRTDVIGTEVVLDITTTSILGILITLELVQDGLNRFSDDVTKDVETTTVGHTENDRFDTSINRTINERLHTRDQRLATLKTETLLVGVFGGNELLKKLGPHESVKDHPLLLSGVVPLGRNLDALSDPVALSPVGDVNVLATNVGTYRSSAVVFMHE